MIAYLTYLILGFGIGFAICMIKSPSNKAKP